MKAPCVCAGAKEIQVHAGNEITSEESSEWKQWIRKVKEDPILVLQTQAWCHRNSKTYQPSILYIS